jgi:hypothetical protein
LIHPGLTAGRHRQSRAKVGLEAEGDCLNLPAQALDRRPRNAEGGRLSRKHPIVEPAEYSRYPSNALGL